MKKNILVLGSSGQLGHHLCQYLTKEKYKVFKFDILDGKKYDLRVSNNYSLVNYIKKSHYVFYSVAFHRILYLSKLLSKRFID